MSRVILAAAFITAFTLLPAPPGSAQPNDELKTLRKDIDELKAGQSAIQKELQDIKTRLRARPAAAPAPPQEAVVSVDGAPFKGEKNAKVTLLEFTDYQ